MGNFRKVREKETKYLSGKNGVVGTGKSKKQIAPNVKNAVAPRDSEISEKWFSEIHCFGEAACLLAFQEVPKRVFPTFAPDFSFFGKFGSFFGRFSGTRIVFRIVFRTFREGSAAMRNRNQKGRCIKQTLPHFEGVVRTYDNLQEAAAKMLSGCKDYQAFRANVDCCKVDDVAYTGKPITLSSYRKILKVIRTLKAQCPQPLCQHQ